MLKAVAVEVWLRPTNVINVLDIDGFGELGEFGEASLYAV